MKILIVEAEQSIASWLRQELMQKGHQVKTVATGSSGLMAALSDEYDLLICDVELPDVHGTEIVRALKAQSPMLPVMTIGGGLTTEWTQACLDAGASCYLQTPIDRGDLLWEVTLVEKARLHLHTILIDADPIHRTRLMKSLTALGCEVETRDSLVELHAILQPGCLLLLDAGMDNALQALTLAKKLGAACFVFRETYDTVIEEKLMRAGAALLMGKPVDIDQLLTQAAFLGA